MVLTSTHGYYNAVQYVTLTVQGIEGGGKAIRHARGFRTNSKCNKMAATVMSVNARVTSSSIAKNSKNFNKLKVNWS